MPIRPRGAAAPQDFHCLLGALGVGLDQDKLAIVIKRDGVGLDHICGQVVIGKMRLEGLDNGVLGMLARLSRDSGSTLLPHAAGGP